MQMAIDFIMQGYKQIEVLKQDANGTTELVLGTDKRTYIRKTLPYVNHAYEELKELRSTQVPHVYYAYVTENATYVIEEYISGVTLQEKLETSGPLAEVQVRNIAMQMAEALEAVHKLKVLHRDIKSSNIMLRENGQAVLIDFGAARLLTREGAKDTCVQGTPGYAPPEQYGFATTDVRSDLYALGMTMRELLGDEYHGNLEQIIERCTEFDPKRRPESAKQLKKLLKRRLGWRWQYAAAVAAVLLFLGGGYALQVSRTPALPVEPPQVEQKQETAMTQADAKQETATPQADAKQKSAAPTEAGQRGEQAAPKAVPQVQKPAGAVEPSPANILFTMHKTSFKHDTHVIQIFGKKIEPAGYKIMRAESQSLGAICNTGDVPLRNPVIKLAYDGMLVCSHDFSYDDWCGKVLIKPVNVVMTDEYGKRFCSQVEVYIKGALPKDEPRLILDGLGSFYASSAHPSVHVVITADNAATFEQEYSLTTDL